MRPEKENEDEQANAFFGFRNEPARHTCSASDTSRLGNVMIQTQSRPTPDRSPHHPPQLQLDPVALAAFEPPPPVELQQLSHRNPGS